MPKEESQEKLLEKRYEEARDKLKKRKQKQEKEITYYTVDLPQIRQKMINDACPDKTIDAGQNMLVNWCPISFPKSALEALGLLPPGGGER